MKGFAGLPHPLRGSSLPEGAFFVNWWGIPKSLFVFSVYKFAAVCYNNFATQLNIHVYFYAGMCILLLVKMQEVFNFDDIGSKIKSFAKWACWIEIILVWIGCAIGLIVSMNIGSEMGVFYALAAVIAPFIIWGGYWCLYAFGEITDAATKFLNKFGKW